MNERKIGDLELVIKNLEAELKSTRAELDLEKKGKNASSGNAMEFSLQVGF